MRAVLLAVVLALLGVVRPVAADEIYFPPGVWGPPDQESGESQAQWDAWYNSFHGRVLKALHERPLWDERAAAGAVWSLRMTNEYSAVSPSKEMIRLSFMEGGRIICVYRREDYQVVNNVYMIGDERYEFIAQAKCRVTADQARRIAVAVAEIEPFSDRTPSRIKDDGGMDGTTTLIEFSGKGTYNAMERWELGNMTGGPLAQLQGILREIMHESDIGRANRLKKDR